MIKGAVVDPIVAAVETNPFPSPDILEGKS